MAPGSRRAECVLSLVLVLEKGEEGGVEVEEEEEKE